MGRSMTGGGGGGPSVAEVTASLPARLLGAMEELKSSKSIKRRRKKKKRFVFSENSKRSNSFYVSPIGLL